MIIHHRIQLLATIIVHSAQFCFPFSSSMARTKQTARKSEGGKVSHCFVSMTNHHIILFILTIEIVASYFIQLTWMMSCFLGTSQTADH
jgi:hypothetical protein